MTIRLLCCLGLCLWAVPAGAQERTPQGMQAQMAEAVNALKREVASLERQVAEAKAAKADPETIKGLEEQLAMMRRQVGLLEGQARGLSRMPAGAFEEAAGPSAGKAGLPARDTKRIAKVPAKALTEPALAAFVTTVHAEVERLLPKERAEAAKIYTALRAEKRSADYVANVASSLWMSGYPEVAILIQGKASAAEPTNVNNLNNYAAFLTMAGGEHAALPILQSLDARFPNNSTILNNIGQAWFGLGDIARAEDALGMALAAYPRHSQANLTMSRIHEARGRTAEAIQAVKRAMQEHYTADKAQRVTDLGGSVSFEEIRFPYPKPKGPWPPLGVEKFAQAIPPYPFTAQDAQVNDALWREFRGRIQAAREGLQPEREAALAKYQAVQARLVADPRRLMPYNNEVHNTAVQKRASLVLWAQDRMARLTDRAMEISGSVDAWRTDMDVVLRNPNSSCAQRAQAALTFMSQANQAYRDYNTAQVDMLQQYHGAMVIQNMYAANDPTEFELLLAGQKDEILATLHGLPYAFQPVCQEDAPPAGHQPRGPLPDFDEVNCDYHDTIEIPPFTTIKIECNKMSTEFDIDTELGLKVKVGWEENLNSGKITQGTLELGYEQGLTPSALGGPIGGEIKVEGAVGIEITSEGLKEAYIKAGASVELTGHVEGDWMDNAFIQSSEGKGFASASAEIKSSWNAGERGGESYVATEASGATPLKAINTPQIRSIP